MNWNTLRIFVGSKTSEQSERAEPLEGVNVTFVLMNEDTSIQFETTAVSDSTGYATLQNTTGVTYTKTNLNIDDDDSLSSKNLVDNTDSDFANVTQWYASFPGTRGTCNSNVYQLQGDSESPESGEVIDRGAASTTNATITTCTVHALIGSAEYASVEVWCFCMNEEGTYKAKYSGTTTTTGVSFTIPSSLAITKVKLHAYISVPNYAKYIFIDSNVRTSTSSTLEASLTLSTFSTLTAYTKSSYFHDFALTNLGKKTGVSPWTLNIKNYNWSDSKSISVSNSAHTSDVSFTAYTPIVYFCGIPGTTPATKFSSGYTKVNMLAYLNYNSTTSLYVTSVAVPAIRKKITIENPVMLDTVSVDLETPVFNLSHVNFEYRLTYGSTLYATFTGSSSYSATTFNLATTTYSNSGSGLDFLKALTTYNNNRKLKVYLTKEHYNDMERILYASASCVNFHTGEQLEEPFFYYCKCNNNGLVNKIQKYWYITREADYCMKGTTFNHYVQGFDYTYNGNVMPTAQTGSDRSISESTPTPTKPGLSGFTLPAQKVIATTSDFFSGCCYETNPKLTYSNYDTTNEFKTGFADWVISEPEYTTQYANSITTHSIEDNNYRGHAYSNRNGCFLPNAGNDFPYLEFYLKEGSESDGRFMLVKIGNPSSQALEYSYWGNDWELYQWEDPQTIGGIQITYGNIIKLVPGAYVRFRNQNNVTKFSQDKDNYYTFWFLDADICARKHISSLINVSANGLTTGSYCFYNLFSKQYYSLYSIGPDYSDNNYNQRLILDPTNVGVGCYEGMFRNSSNLVLGAAKINATTGGKMCFYEMFTFSTNMRIGPDSINLTAYTSGCCASMFNYCLKLQNPPILTNASAITTFNEMCFNSMFFNCGSMNFNEEYKLGKLNDLTVKDNACEAMFKNCSSLTETARFQPTLISYSGCSEMFYDCKNITGNKFSMTGGTVRNFGCNYMFYNNKFTTVNKISATTLGIGCYYAMFLNCDSLSCTLPDLPATAVPASAYAYMFASAGTPKYGFSDNPGSGSLTVNATLLTATSISPYCYAYMFYHSGLKKVPYLPATTLYEGCYSHMFNYANLNLGNGFYHGFSINKTVRGQLGSTAGTEVVLNATVLPKKCYEYMFANSNIKRVLYVINTGVTEAGEQSCSHMFETTKIEFEPYFRFMCLNGKEERVLTCKDLNQVTFTTSTNDSDFMRNVMTDFFFDDNKVKVLSGITVRNAESSTKHFLIGYYQNSSRKYTSQRDIYLHRNDGIVDLTNLTNYYGYFSDATTPFSDVYETGDAFVAQYYHSESDYYWNRINGTSDSGYVPSGFLSVYDNPGLCNPFISGNTGGSNPVNVWWQTGYMYSLVSNGLWYLRYRTSNGWSSPTSVYKDLREFKSFNKDTFFVKYSFDEPATVGDNSNAPRGSWKFNYQFKTKKFYVHLGATTLGKNCYEYMFSNCDDIYAGHHFTFNPSLTNTTEGCFNHMFENCDYLKSVQSSITNLNLSKCCFEGMYSHCGDYDYEDGKHYKQGLELCADYHIKFSGQSPDNSASFPTGGMIHRNPKVESYDDGYAIKYGIYLKSAWTLRDAITFDKTLYEGCFRNMFSDCNCIEEPKIHLKKTTLAKGCYEGMFSGCVRMVSGVQLTVSTAGTASDSCFKNMFRRCVNFIGPSGCPTLHQTVQQSCYEGMFAYCFAMSASPYLPARTLSTDSYKQMFFNAIAHEYVATVKCSFTGTAFVGGTRTYNDEFRIKYHHVDAAESYFTYERGTGDSECSPRVRRKGSGSSGNVSSWMTYYTMQDITGSMDDDVFFGDAHVRFVEMLKADSEIGSFFDNVTTAYNSSGNKHQLVIEYPQCLNFHEHLSRIKTVMQNFMDDYYANNTDHRYYYLGAIVIKITNHSVSTTNGYINPSSGVKYIIASLKSTEAGAEKTSQWVLGLSGFGSNGIFIRASDGPTGRGDNLVPPGWTLTTGA